MVTSDKSDDELLLAFQAGNRQAYEAIYDRYWQLLFRHARKMLNDETAGKDVVQEVFAALWAKRNDQLIKPPLAALLYHITRNKVLDLIKHSKVEEKYYSSLKKIMEASEALPDELYIERELYERIEEEISRLPEKMRIVFEMSRKAHKSHKEIADELGISDKTVKKQVSNAIHILKDKLGDTMNIFLIIF